MQYSIGISEALTDWVLGYVKSAKPSSKFLAIYELLLLERFDEAIPLISSILQRKLDKDYRIRLQQSKFFIHRKSVPLLIKNIEFADKKKILKNALADPICEVVREAVNSLSVKNPFKNDELLEIAFDLYSSRFIGSKVLTVDILILLNESSFLLSDSQLVAGDSDLGPHKDCYYSLKKTRLRLYANLRKITLLKFEYD